jgi:energy-coupling factor transporter ATP-binding protein EcfA2
MRLKTLQLKRWRSYEDATIAFDPHFTVLVGENGVGKTAIQSALTAIFARLASESGNRLEQPYDKTDFSLALELETEFVDQIVDALVPLVCSACAVPINGDTGPATRSYLESKAKAGTTVRIRVGPGHENVVLSLGHLHLGNRRFFSGASAPPLDQPLPQAQQGGSPMEAIQRELARSATGWMTVSGSVLEVFNKYAIRYSSISEFRSPSILKENSRATEASTGSDTAAALYTLKNSASRSDRDRYAKVVDKFSRFFPDLHIEAIERDKNVPDVLATSKTTGFEWSVSELSAGTNQILTILLGALGRHRWVTFVDHPESHIHPHGLRLLRRALYETPETTQVILITHDAHFVDPADVPSIRRVYRAGTSSKISDPGADLSEIKPEQLHTAMRSLQAREMLFSRAVLLVEDESHERFLRVISERLGNDLDSRGVSLLAVDGEGNFKLFVRVLRFLRIPFVALRDNKWTDPERYPGGSFFSFDMEIEEYLQEHGLGALLDRAPAAVGRSKPRQAAWVAGELELATLPPIFHEILNAVTSAADPTYPAVNVS